ncbi:hypothetical protein CAPTEDRAFT_220336 [Capitella teleta]|uniref:Apple domain-containing protein n=1 Tax=Capitella teleta TaxID=283909 RepID=R7TX09_CAPTE|nr:hypothetical protein CAPTEDRAFT_220336 [Capitella teleta]|eukprot:ELT98264.1 hypothetical protein CAPTEDRAFT_220336 [Capitella teleta]
MDVIRVVFVLCLLNLVRTECLDQLFVHKAGFGFYNDYIPPLLDTNSTSTMECASHCVHTKCCLTALATFTETSQVTGRPVYRCQLYAFVAPSTLSGPVPGHTYYIKENVRGKSWGRNKEHLFDMITDELKRVGLQDVLQTQSVWVPYPGMELATLNNKEIHAVMTATQCMALCEQETSFVCHSVDYTSAHCYLSGSTQHTLPMYFMSVTGNTYYERSCV